MRTRRRCCVSTGVKSKTKKSPASAGLDPIPKVYFRLRKRRIAARPDNPNSASADGSGMASV